MKDLENDPMNMPAPAPEPRRAVPEQILQKALAAIGAVQTGDPVPFWVDEILRRNGTKLSVVPLAYYDFLQDAVKCTRYVDARFPQPGDIGILQRNDNDLYWAFVVVEVRQNGIDAVVAQSFHHDSETEVRRVGFSWPNYNDTWHCIGLIRF